MKKFQVKATIQRPGIFQYGGSNPLRARTPAAWSHVRPVPASFQYVEVYQNETFGSFCGSAFTDAEGTLDGVTFSGGDNYPNEVRLVVYGDSRWGFRVGYNSPYPWEQLATAYAWQWSTPWVDAGRSKVDVGLLRLGADGSSWKFLEDDRSITSDDPKVNSFRAAAVFEILDMIYHEFGFGYLASNWIINDVLADIIGSQAPWTYWNTVHMRDDLETGYLLGSVPHELGHVLYNRNHSGQLHYDTDCWMDYLHQHEACSDFGPHFGHYEGYADAFANLFWRHHAQRLGRPEYSDPEGLCDRAGIAREGNVNAFYSHAFAGEPLDRPPGSMHSWTTSRIGANDYYFPPTHWLFQIVNRRLSEDLNQLWSHSMHDINAGFMGGLEPYCLSRRFRCKVADELVLPTDVFPPEYKHVDCMPGSSRIWRSTTTPGSIEVSFDGADFVDSYEIVMEIDGTATTIPVDPANHGWPNMVQTVPAPNCGRATLFVRTHNEHGSTDGNVVEVFTDCQMAKPVIDSIECTHHPARGPIALPHDPPIEPGGGGADGNGSLVELPGVAAGFDCDVSFTTSPQADAHRLVHAQAGGETEFGPWIEESDGTARLWIENWNVEHRVAIEAMRYETTVSSGFTPIDFPDVPRPPLTLQMATKRRTFVVDADHVWRYHGR